MPVENRVRIPAANSLVEVGFSPAASQELRRVALLATVDCGSACRHNYYLPVLRLSLRHQGTWSHLEIAPPIRGEREQPLFV